MKNYFCPDNERSITIVMDQYEARHIYQALGNASRWEDLGDAELALRAACEEFEDRCMQRDRDDQESGYRNEMIDDEEVEGFPNVLEDVGEDDS